MRTLVEQASGPDDWVACEVVSREDAAAEEAAAAAADAEAEDAAE